MAANRYRADYYLFRHFLNVTDEEVRFLEQNRNNQYVVAFMKDFHGDQVSSLKNEALLKHLERLWGRKLGRDNSNEANSARWVYAALTDFQGRLQARDIVRMLWYAW